MYRQAINSILLLLLATGWLNGQEDVRIKKSDFRIEKAGFSQAWDHVIAGDAFYAKKGAFYSLAFSHYIQALAYNNSNAALNYKTGIAAIYAGRKEEAAGFFNMALEKDPEVAPDLLLYAGRALQYSGDFRGAIDKLTKYIESQDKKHEENISVAKKFIEECNSAIELCKDTLAVEITNTGGNINSGSDDFAPVFTYDGRTLYFASRKKTGKSSSDFSAEAPDENIYMSKLIGGVWGVSNIAGENLTTPYNESPLYVDTAETKLFIYSGSENGGDIKMTETRRGDWKSPVDLPYPVNSSNSETSIALPLKGDEIFFISNNPKESLGGYDIFVIRRTGERKWSRPENLGPVINTAYDEQSVSISESGDTLWFSSRGHNTMGGFDIFFSVRDENGKWSKAVNAGYPVNTQWDELFFTKFRAQNGIYYFSSNRSGGLGGLDIYKLKMLSDKDLTQNSE